ncbi:hypothetical protein AUJ84_04630 [Candidatus Pacearchaeota archaeon CG1_02_32_132]|nr:MAG: hypothetical protein AUJ84_04630 [Candidatus Pacearchaeota archaeon CG1_02_32_132]
MDLVFKSKEKEKLRTKMFINGRALFNSRKMVKRSFVFAFGFVLMVFLMVNVSAGFACDLFGIGCVGKSPVDVGATVGNEAPVITSMSTPGTVIPLGSGTRAARFDFIVSDPNGAGDINVASALSSYTGSGNRESGPVTATCTEAPTCAANVCTGSQKNITCTGTMQYYHDAGTWAISASIKDSGLNTATCGVGGSVACKPFVYTSVLQMTSSPAGVGFGSISLTSTNQPAVDDPVILTNKGNLDFVIDITPRDLIGETNSLKKIPSQRFSAGGTTGGSPLAECNTTGVTGKGFSTNGIAVTNIPGVNVLYGSTGNTDNLYFCLWANLQGDALTNQVYSAKSANAWQVTEHV